MNIWDTILTSPIFALFVIITFGYLIGNIKVKGVSLDVSAVIFVALLFGHYGVVLPDILSSFGMILFIFTIGIQAGPGFFSSFRSKGKSLIVMATIIIVSASLVAVLSKYLFNLNTAQAVGLLTGALTSTPGLAAAKDLVGDSTAVAYGIAYPFGVIGVILFIKLLPKLTRSDVAKAERKLEKEIENTTPVIESKVFMVTNENVFNKSLKDLNVRAVTGAVISRIKHNDSSAIPTAKTVLNKGDILKAVGSIESLSRMESFIGKSVDQEIKMGADFTVSVGLISTKALINTRLDSLNLQNNFQCVVTRIRRSGIDLQATPDIRLKMGDKLTIAGNKEYVDEVLKMIGNDSKSLSDINLLPVAFGVVLGILFGKLTLFFGNSISFSFGLTGGILMTALLLSAKGKTGPIIWSMSSVANQLLRQLGLVLFLAGVGTSAGSTFVETFSQYGWSMFLAGVMITVIPMIIAVVVGSKILKINILDMLGVVSGGMTSTPGLAASDSMSRSSAPAIAYATVYPVAMVLLILCVQIIVSFS